MKAIRWPGFLVFVVLLGLGTFFFFFFIDGFVKRSIENIGSTWVGAQVNLNEANLSLFPLGLRINRLQVTDREKPMQNAVEIAEIAFLFDPELALRRKFLINEMTVDGIQLNRPRESSGAISPRPEKIEPPKKKDEREKIQLPALDLPDIDEILEKEPLESIKQAEAIRDDIKKTEADWKARLKALPNKEKLKSYEARVKKLKKASKGGLEGILGGISELDTLNKEIKADIKKIRSAKNQLDKDLRRLKTRVQTFPKVPMNDINRLKEKYSLSPKGLSKVSRMLLGDQIGNWIEMGLRGYETLQPHLDKLAAKRAKTAPIKPPRGKGIDIHFREQTPVPDFLIQTAHLSIELKEGAFSGEAHQITAQQSISGKPLSFQLIGKQIKNLDAIQVQGEFNRVDPDQAHDSFQIKSEGYRINPLSLSKGKDFPVDLKGANANFESLLKFRKGHFDANLSAQLQAVALTVDLKDSVGTMAKAMAGALSEVKAFGLKAEAAGAMDDYDFKLSSDLDDVLKKAVGKQVQVQAKKFEAQLKSAITEKVNQAVADLQSKTKGLDALMAELGIRENLGDKILKDALKKSTDGLKLPF